MRIIRLPAIAVAAAIGLASAGAGAAVILPGDAGALARLGDGATLLLSMLEAGYAAHAHPTVGDFAGPYRLMVAGTGQQNLSDMLLASLGLMAIIAYRRRSL